MFNKRLTNAKMAPESFRHSQARFAFFTFLLYLIWSCRMGSSSPQGFGCQRLGFVKKKVCVFSLGDAWLNMGCVNNKWVCLLAEWQIPNVSSKLKRQAHSSPLTSSFLTLTATELKGGGSGGMCQNQLSWILGSSLGTRQLQLSKTTWNETKQVRESELSDFYELRLIKSLTFLFSAEVFSFLIVFPVSNSSEKYK